VPMRKYTASKPDTVQSTTAECDVFCHTYRSSDHADHYEDKYSSFIPTKYHYLPA